MRSAALSVLLRTSPCGWRALVESLAGDPVNEIADGARCALVHSLDPRVAARAIAAELVRSGRDGPWDRMAELANAPRPEYADALVGLLEGEGGDSVWPASVLGRFPPELLALDDIDLSFAVAELLTTLRELAAHRAAIPLDARSSDLWEIQSSRVTLPDELAFRIARIDADPFSQVEAISLSESAREGRDRAGRAVLRIVEENEEFSELFLADMPDVLPLPGVADWTARNLDSSVAARVDVFSLTGAILFASPAPVSAKLDAELWRIANTRVRVQRHHGEPDLQLTALLALFARGDERAREAIERRTDLDARSIFQAIEHHEYLWGRPLPLEIRLRLAELE